MPALCISTPMTRRSTSSGAGSGSASARHTRRRCSATTAGELDTEKEVVQESTRAFDACGCSPSRCIVMCSTRWVTPVTRNASSTCPTPKTRSARSRAPVSTQNTGTPSTSARCTGRDPVVSMLLTGGR
jgi:hypothetical protein